MTAYADLDQQQLDREYSPSSRAPDFEDTLGRYATQSAEALASLRCSLNVRYGPGPEELVHFFPADRPAAPVVVYVHGGHWQALSKEDSCFAAPQVVAAGAAFAALGYGLAPGCRLDQMVRSVRRGLHWFAQNAARLGLRSDAIYAAGSSAGAHLVAAATSRIPGGRAQPVAGLCLLSGVYDLEPIRLSYVNDAVGLDQAAARAHSPLFHLPLAAGSVIVARGGAETAEYARQHESFARALVDTGHRVVDLVDPGRNHFDLPLDLGVRGTALGDALLAQLDLR